MENKKVSLSLFNMRNVGRQWDKDVYEDGKPTISRE